MWRAEEIGRDEALSVALSLCVSKPLAHCTVLCGGGGLAGRYYGCECNKITLCQNGLGNNA